MTNIEGRVILRNKALEPPAGVRTDVEILCELASRLGKREFFSSAEPRDIFEELCRASAGGAADYSGMSYEKIEANQGVFWPCPSEDHSGTPRLFADGFPTSTGKARFHAVRHAPPNEQP